MGDDQLTRRDVLAGLGTLGAGIGAGAVGYRATSAAFTDAERFAGNLLTAGELDIAVDYAVTIRSYDGTTDARTGTVDGNAEGGVELGELHPGDRGRVDLCPRVPAASNPAYLWLCGGLVDTGNGPSATESGPYDPGHNLAEALQARVRYVTPSNDDPLWCPDSATDETGVILEGSFADVLSQLAAGLPLDADGRLRTLPGDQACFSPDGDHPCLRLEWCLPASAGNAVEGDTVEFDLVVRARQCRHTDGTTNPCTPDDDTPQAISFVSFCTADGSDDFAVDLSWDDTDTNADGEVTAVDWEITDGDPDIDTVVLYYATTFENTYYPDSSPTSGTAAVGEGDERLPWPPGGETEKTGQSPSDPCPGEQRGVKYEWLEQAQEFDRV